MKNKKLKLFTRYKDCMYDYLQSLYIELRNLIQCSWVILASIIFLLISIIICCYVPDYYLEKYQTSTYMESGQIGDIVGGTTAPLIALLASFLTFLAFGAQYKANRIQRSDISLEHFESNLYEMLHIHRDNLYDLKCGKDVGRDAVCSYCYKLKLIYILVKIILNQLGKSDQEKFGKFCQQHNYTSEKAETIIAYNLFFYGDKYSKIQRFDKDETQLYQRITSVINNFQEARINVNESTGIYDEEIISKSSESIVDFLKNYNGDIEADLDICNLGNISVPDFLLNGYDEKLGVYYRQLYQIVKFVDGQKELSERKKYEYMRIIRSQLSAHEQLLLYYNGLSEIGEAWNKVPKDNSSKRKMRYSKNQEADWKVNMGLIARYRLIKNIPVSFTAFGHRPDAQYMTEIILYTSHEINFYEVARPVYG